MTKKNKTILIVILVVCAAIVTVLAVRHYSKPDFTKMSPRQIREYFDSNQFRDANEDKKREIREEMGDAMRSRMEAQANEYSALRDYEKTAYLDKLIDDMEARRAEFMAREANDANGPPDFNGPPDPNRFARFGPADANRPGFGQGGPNMGQRPKVNPERRRERSSRMSTDTRVKMNQFRRDMMNRMQERGISGPGGGGGRGGGGMGGGPGGGGPGGP